LAVQGLEGDLRKHFYADLTPDEQRVYDAMVIGRRWADAARILRENQSRFFEYAQSLSRSTLSLHHI
jgi:hypothetical protein